MAIREQETKSNEINFLLNGERVKVENPDPKVVLGDYLRYEKGLKGLQQPCKQGGCGACTIVLTSSDCRGNVVHTPINSCLRPLCAVDGMALTTVEGVGTQRKGLHPVQEQIVKNNATQCGFCTPGMVMSMYGLLKNSSQPTQQEVEDQLDGNLCRCTGYRPLLNAFQTFSNVNCHYQESGVCSVGGDKDIEELYPQKAAVQAPSKFSVSKDGLTWIRAVSLPQLYTLLRVSKNHGGVRMIRGNTSVGIYPPSPAKVIVDISHIQCLSKISSGISGIIIGGAVPISDLMTVLDENINLSPSYGPLLKHLKRVATPQVRNVGSVAGNLALTHRHGEFPSDVATILMASEARLKLALANTHGLEQMVSLREFFQMSLDGVVILEIHIPALRPKTHFLTYKVALRRVNAHAILNAAFKFDIDSMTGIIRNSPVIVYGGVRPQPQRARQTEAYLLGKSCFEPLVFERALEILRDELVVDPSMGRTQYRTLLVSSYFFKAMLSLWPKESVPHRLKSTIKEYVRPISIGSVSFDEGDPSEYPVSKPIPKLSAAIQATGEAEYMDDVNIWGELHASFVLSTVANAAIKKIDASKALETKGVVTFLSAETIAADGYCNFVSDYEEVFVSKRVQFFGQAIGLLVASSKAIADAATELVEVEYTDVQPPIITIEDAISANSFFDERGLDIQLGTPEVALQESEVIVEGQVSVGHQYHFHLETQRALCVPGEDCSMTVYSSTQNPTQVQHCVGVAINQPQHKITVVVKRIGGAFGAKLNRSPPIAMACAFAADKLRRPVRLVLDLSTNMQLVGARSPYLCKYKIGVQKDGRISAVKMDIINNQGAYFDFEYPDMGALTLFLDNAYNIPNWDLYGKVARTNLPACTYMRGPVFVESVFMIETAIEHVAHVLGLDADCVREINMYNEGDFTPFGQHLIYCNAKDVMQAVKKSSNYEKRLQEVQQFNSVNQWVKRGIAHVPVKFLAVWEGLQHMSLVNVYPDGSISIFHSGIEIGQGLDVKVAQVAAMTLGSSVRDISLENIRVHTTTTVIANNVAETGGSVTSEICAMAVKDACQQIVDRLSLVIKLLSTGDEKPRWEELVAAAVESGIDLQARSRVMPGAGPNGICQYVSFGAGVTEAEVDILTGDTRLLRCDLLLDCGKSLNPAIDIGQVQGAYVQGLGYFLSEEFIYDYDSGKLLSDGTWEYKPPSAKDIPYEFRTELLHNSSNPSGFLRSKFSGEPPYGFACSALLAVRHAVAAGKAEWGNDDWCSLNSPATVERVLLAAGLPLSTLNLPPILHQ